MLNQRALTRRATRTLGVKNGIVLLFGRSGKRDGKS